MSYSNSIFTTINSDGEKNKIFSYKIVLYSIVNPGGGILLSSFALIPSCQNNDNIGIASYIVSIIIGLIIIFCPISLSLGVFLSKLTNKMITLFPLKITLIYIGFIGIVYSFFTSGINKRKIREAKNLIVKPLNAFDILYKCGESITRYNSEFNIGSFFRLLANIFIPELGKLSLLCKYGCKCSGIFVTAFFQFFIGNCFF